MKTIGLIGGTTWVSSTEYYRIINQEVQRRRGGEASARLILYSLDFDQVSMLQQKERHDDYRQLIIDAGRSLESAGAELIAFAANTTHMFVDEFTRAVPLPLVSIVDATARAIRDRGLSKVALLGTRFTMQMGFYKDRLKAHGIETLVPEALEIDRIHSVIHDELSRGRLDPASKSFYLACIDRLVAKGAEGAILGCTEIPLLVQQRDTNVPLFDTTSIHCQAIVDAALADSR